MATLLSNSPNFETLTSVLAKKDARGLEADLSAFAHRFPVSGRIVHALAQEFGGVMGLAKVIESKDEGGFSRTWMGEKKATALKPEELRRLFDEKTLEEVSLHLAIPRESVEIQTALGIPKFFNSLSHGDDELDLGYSLAKKKPGKSGKRGSTIHP